MADDLGVALVNASAQQSALRILIVDDHAIVREGLKRILEETDRHWAVTEATGGFEALALLRSQPFDLAIIDLSMPDMSGLDLLRRARAEFSGLGCLILSMHAEEQYAMRAFKAGANGYVTKDSAPGDLAQAVRKVAAGGAYVSSAVAERMVLAFNGAQAPAGHTLLSDRELDVLRRLTAGQRPTEIARALHLSVKTVSTHKSRIQEKLGLPSTAALIRYGLEHELGSNLPVSAV
jgi:DNA-binding NarL/FixJ family response regulator